ncbi:uncharacterized protein LOC144237838 [Crocuta crocuta]
MLWGSGGGSIFTAAPPARGRPRARVSGASPSPLRPPGSLRLLPPPPAPLTGGTSSSVTAFVRGPDLAGVLFSPPPREPASAAQCRVRSGRARKQPSSSRRSSSGPAPPRWRRNLPKAFGLLRPRRRRSAGSGEAAKVGRDGRREEWSEPSRAVLADKNPEAEICRRKVVVGKIRAPYKVMPAQKWCVCFITWQEE